METHLIYISRINSVIDYIEANLEYDMTLEELASVSFFSKYHFSRVFWGITGETPFEFIKRLRLEKASTLLKIHPRSSVSEIAIKCGYNNLAVFSRNFKAFFNVSPTQWRRKKTAIRSHSDRANRNYSKTFEKPAFYLDSELNRNTNMKLLRNAEVRDLQATTVAYIRHTGPYQGDNELFSRLFGRILSWAEARGLMDRPNLRPMIIYHDDPCITDEEKLRTSVCINVPPDTTVDGEVGKMDISGGRCLSARFVLKPQEFVQAWKWIYGEWFPNSGYQPKDALPFEVYPEPPQNGKLTVEICIPVKPL